jgi:hypothetical protein
MPAPPPPTPEQPSNAAKIVDKIETYLAGTADIATASYTISAPNGSSRQLSRCTHSELLDLLKYWKGILADEKKAAAGRRRPCIRFRW